LDAATPEPGVKEPASIDELYIESEAPLVVRTKMAPPKAPPPPPPDGRP
jgi:hypothetical protein